MFNFSEFSSSEQRLQGQDHEALLQKTGTLKRELERLQILNERLHGEGCKRQSCPELQSLQSQLRQGLLNVGDQLAQKRIKMDEDEKPVKQEHNHVAPVRNIASMKWEIKRLRLLNERMIGKELDGLSFFELMVLKREMMYGLYYVQSRKLSKKEEELISELKMQNGGSGQSSVPVAEHEQSSLDNGTDDHGSNISSPLRSLGINY